MWKDLVEQRFFWRRMEGGIEKLLYELIKAEEEEDAGIYLLLMHYNHAREDLPFKPEDRRKTLHLLSILIGDSRKHQRLLQEAIERLEKARVEK